MRSDCGRVIVQCPVQWGDGNYIAVAEAWKQEEPIRRARFKTSEPGARVV